MPLSAKKQTKKSGDNDFDNLFATIVEEYTESAYAVAYQLIRNVHDTEDVVQDSFVKIWKNMSTFKKDTHPKAWVLTIVRNTALDFLRKRRPVVFSEFDQEDGENFLTATLASDDPSPLDESIWTEDAEVLKLGLEKLSPRSREVLNLRYAEELSFEEISDVLKRPLNTVKSQVRRALAELRGILIDAPK